MSDNLEVKPDIMPDIVIQLNIFTHRVMVYRAEVVVYNGAGKELYSFTEFYSRMGIRAASIGALRIAAQWVRANGYSGLVEITGNAASDVGGTTSAGITKYKTEGSELYLKPFASWYEEQKVTGLWLEYEEEEEETEEEGNKEAVNIE